MKILVLGAGGMAGHVVSLYLREKGHDVDTLSATNPLDKNTFLVDLTKKEVFESFLASHTYDVIVNCVGVLVEQSEKRRDLASYLNAYLPHQLESVHKDSKTKIIHLSTDCVFSGDRAPYTEDAPYDGQLFYDRSKALGEIKNDKDLTFRMSIIGPDQTEKGVGLFNWFMKQKGKISGYTNVKWTGVTTIKLAEAIDEGIKQNLTGLYHLVPDQNISKYSLLCSFNKVFDRGVTIKEDNSQISDKTLLNTRKDFEFTIGSYESMVSEMKTWVDDHKEIYKHYFDK